MKQYNTCSEVVVPVIVDVKGKHDTGTTECVVDDRHGEIAVQVYPILLRSPTNELQ